MRVPAEFAESTVRREGRRGEAWISDLPALIERLLAEWQLEPEGSVFAGHVALVVFVRRQDRTPAVLKVSWLDRETRDEHRALSWWAGRGAVALMAADPRRGALLLERLESARSLEHVDEAEALTAAGLVLRQLHVPPPPGLPTLRDLAERWQEQLFRQWWNLGRPGLAPLVSSAATTCRELPQSPGEPVLLHGDYHYGNVLGRSGQGWAAIDPKPLVGDGEYDLLPLLRNRWAEIASTRDVATAVRRRLAYLCESTGLDHERARRWSQARAVEDALWGLEHELDAFADIAWAIAGALERS